MAGGANALAQLIYKSELKDYKMVLADLTLARDGIILSSLEFIVKILEDSELGIALVTEFQIVTAAYLELGTMHMNDLEEVRAQFDNPICDSFDVHLADFMERCVFLATNIDTVSPVEMILTLTKSHAILPVLHAWALRFNEFFRYLSCGLRQISLHILALEFVTLQLQMLAMHMLYKDLMYNLLDESQDEVEVAVVVAVAVLPMLKCLLINLLFPPLVPNIAGSMVTKDIMVAIAEMLN